MTRTVIHIGMFELDAEPFAHSDGTFTARVHVKRIADGKRMKSREFPGLERLPDREQAMQSGLVAGRDIVRELQAAVPGD